MLIFSSSYRWDILGSAGWSWKYPFPQFNYSLIKLKRLGSGYFILRSVLLKENGVFWCTSKRLPFLTLAGSMRCYFLLFSWEHGRAHGGNLCQYRNSWTITDTLLVAQCRQTNVKPKGHPVTRAKTSFCGSSPRVVPCSHGKCQTRITSHFQQADGERNPSETQENNTLFSSTCLHSGKSEYKEESQCI